MGDDKNTGIGPERPRSRFGGSRDNDADKNDAGSSGVGSGGSRFDSSNRNSRFGRSSSTDKGSGSNTKSAVPPAPTRPSSRFSPFGNQQQLSWAMLPTHKVVVHFELGGLGDPFYKLLGKELNTDHGDGKVVAETLEKGGEYVGELEEKLNEIWDEYKLQGAAMVYKWNAKTWNNIATADIFPARIPGRFGQRTDNNEEEEKPLPEPTYTCLRALDLQLVLNILARARTQLLLADAPLVFSQQYLNRSIVADDPRLVKLVRATGFIQEKL